MVDSNFLSDIGLGVVNYIEKHHSVTSTIPPDAGIISYITKHYDAIGDIEIRVLKGDPLFKASLESRGIIVNYDLDREFKDVTELTAKQMAAASLLMNVADRRSDEKKLRDLGISTEEWSNWMLDINFAEYLRERSEVLVANSTHLAHLGLIRGVNQGNTASLKLYYEMTGRYNPNTENNVNIRMVIGRVLEAIQKHIRDPQVLNALAVEMSQIAIESGSSPVAKNTIIPDSSTRKEIS